MSREPSLARAGRLSHAWRVACAALALAALFTTGAAAATPDATDALADALTAAAASERERLLARAPDLQTPALTQALIARADTLRVKGEFARALELFELALGVSTRAADLVGQAAALRGAGIAHAVRGELAMAQESFTRSIAVAEQAGDKAALARALGNLGSLFTQQGDYARAIENQERSVALLEQLGDLPALAGPLGNLALVSMKVGSFDQALQYADRALALSQAAGNKVWTARLYNIVANTYEWLGDYARALENYDRSLATAEEAGDKEQAAGVTSNIGGLYRLQGDNVLARQQVERAHALFEALGSKGEAARTLARLAFLDEQQHEYTRALAEGEQALAVFEAIQETSGTGTALEVMGTALLRLGRLDEAQARYEAALARAESMGAPGMNSELLIGLAEVQAARGRPAEAEHLAARSVELARRSGYRESLWRACVALARARRTLGQAPAAREALEEAIATVEVMRTQAAGGEVEQQRVFEDRLAPYRLLLDLDLEEGRTREAFALAERTKARVLSEVMASGRVHLSKAMSAAEQQEERRLNAEIVSANLVNSREQARPGADERRLRELALRLERARAEHGEYLVRLYAAHPELRVQRGELAPIELAQAAELLTAPGAALLEYTLTEAGAYLFVLTPQAGEPVLRSYRLAADPAELARRCRELRGRLATRDLDFGAPARTLYDLLLAPAAEQLRGRTRLVLVPDGPLWELPFQALQSRAGHALIEDYSVSYAPSLTVLWAMSRAGGGAPRAKPSLLAFGNPTLEGAGVKRIGEYVPTDTAFEPLPEAERQVQALGRLYGPERARVYVGREATEERVKTEAGRYRILHFATHGILDDRSPMYSKITFAPAPADKEDGLLEAREIMDLDLHADLAVLSACESGRGRVGAGEGLIGLTWAFFVAGCPATVASLWKVESASTTELMLELHRRLEAGEDKAQALQRASLKVARSARYRHPFYWAGFVALGDPR